MQFRNRNVEQAKNELQEQGLNLQDLAYEAHGSF